ncbi:MAG: hypothetical protein O8C66_15620 [Candidatus Methanoperedens sp.]|nr:hypothetical protein [Candidatus Methanoperedens sp.]MCZ7371926.1 hypothetical protein [Candidatus Methanoperedens sp.]
MCGAQRTRSMPHHLIPFASHLESIAVQDCRPTAGGSEPNLGFDARWLPGAVSAPELNIF